MSAGPWDSLIVGAGAEAVRIRRMDALDFYGRGTVAVQPGAQVEVVLRSDYLTALAQRDAARDIAVRLEGELARVREIVTAWSLGETHRDEMVLWAIRDIVGLTSAKPDNPTPWPHPDAVIAEGES